MFKQYKRKSVSEMRPYVEGEVLDNVSVSGEDAKAGSPKVGDMIARNPKNHDDQWLVAKAYFEDNLELLQPTTMAGPGKSLGNTDASGATKNVKDIVFWGDGDLWKLISKASSQTEGWMKSTKAMELHNGCLVQVTTQQGNSVAEAVVFVPGITIFENKDREGNIESRKLMPK